MMRSGLRGLGLLLVLCGGGWCQDYRALRWRMIGPYRGGRTVAAVGVPGKPNVFYIGANNGGVWKSTDYGRVWRPIFDDQPTGSIGALAVAPADPNTIYAGSGEGLQRPDLSVGDGVYKSTDGGKTWTNTGLRDGQQISAILVDPRDANRVYVAVLGHPYGPNTERGVYRSLNGGETWERILYKDENSGAMDLAFDPRDPRTIYAVLWAGRQAPWEIGGSFNGPGSGLYKSTDGGDSWRPLTKGLPTIAQGLGRIGLGVAPSDGNRIYAVVDASPQMGGLYRSEDGGESWRKASGDPRIWGRGSDFAHVRVDPKNKDKIYIANVALHVSDDGGVTFRVLRGAPGGDDYHTVWINPNEPDILLVASDQGAIVSVNGGDTWSSWYNQPTAQFYHVITDNQFPYWVYGGQQESGSAGVASRGNDGQITFREWHPVGVEEYGYVAPDPLHPHLIYGGKVTRYNTLTGEVQHVGPYAGRGGKYRALRTAPLVFSMVDKRVLFFGANQLFKTVNGGDTWDVISPDLSRETYEVPASLGIFAEYEPEKGKRRGVIYTVAPSYKDVNVIWAGTDDGLIHVTRDGGKTWRNVTPPGVTAWSKVSVMDAGRFDAGTAYAAINRFRCDDLKPHVYRTQDFGKTWQKIVNGLPENAPINAVREDPVRKGLLFAGSERAAWVSFDDGEQWKPLRLNMPAISIRDLVVHDDDLVVGTHGRGFWILDNITPLRQMKEFTSDHLFEPQVAYRVRWNKNTDTPLPIDEPVGENPPDGAMIDYTLQTAGKVVLEIFDSGNRLVRRFASDDPAPPPDGPLQIADYWIRPAQRLGTETGMHRFVWDLHYPMAPVSGGRSSYPIAAVYRNTPREPRGPAAMPGRYTVKLTVNGKTYSQPLVVKMDPRVKAGQAELQKQFDLSMKLCEAILKANGRERGELVQLLNLLQSAESGPTKTLADAVALKLSNQ